MLALLLPTLVGCGGAQASSGRDRAAEEELEREAAAEARGETEAEHAAHENDRRLRATETRIYQHCYEDIEHLETREQDRRRVRVTRAGRPDVGQVGSQTHHVRPTNVDVNAQTSAYSEQELSVIIAEDQLDIFHAEHATPSEWTSDDLTRFEDLADDLIERCDATR